MGVPGVGLGGPVEAGSLRPLLRTHVFSPLVVHNHLVIHVIHTPTTSTSSFK
jgi:hypothetical protein